MDPITIGLATAAIATPVFTGIYGLGSMIYAYATTAPVNTINTYIASNANALVVRSSGALVAVQQATQEILPTCAKLVASKANAVAIRGSNALVAVKEVIQPVCEAVAPQPLMIAPPPSPSLITENNFLSSSNYTNIIKSAYDIYQVGSKVKDGEYVYASAYAAGAALDYALNETVSSGAGHYIESLTGVTTAGSATKLVTSLVSSLLFRTVLPVIADKTYQYLYPKLNEKTEALVKNFDENQSKVIKPVILNPDIKTKLETKIKRETQKIDSTQAKPVIVPDKSEVVPKVLEKSDNKNNLNKVQQPKRLTGKKRAKERKREKYLENLVESETKAESLVTVKAPVQESIQAQAQAQAQAQTENIPKSVNLSVSSIVSKTPVVSEKYKKMPTPLERKMAQLAKKASVEKVVSVNTVSINKAGTELERKSFKVYGCNTNLNCIRSQTMKVECDDRAPSLSHAKFVFDALKNLMKITKIAEQDEVKAAVLKTPKPSVIYREKPKRFDRYDADRNTETHRSFARMIKAEGYLKETKESKYSDPDMIERQERMFLDARAMFEKDSALMSSMPDNLPRFAAARK